VNHVEAQTIHLLTPEELDSLLRYPRGRAIKLAKTGLLPAIFLPDGEVRFDRGTIAEVLAGMTKRPEEGATDVPH
jgi:hypothetical protein